MEKKQYTMIDILKITFKCSKGHSSLIAFQKLTEGIIPSIRIILVAGFLDTAIQIAKGEKGIYNIILPITLVAALIAYSWISAQLIKFVDAKLEFALRESFRVSITEKIAKLKYKYIENQDVWDLISRLSKEPEVLLKKSYLNILSLVSIFLRILGILSILITKVWWASVAILLISIPLIIVAIKGGRASYDAIKEVSKHVRKYEYLEEVLRGRDAVSERAIFGFTNEINESWKEQYEITRKIQFKVNAKVFAKLKAGGVVTAFITTIMSMVLIKPVLDNLLSVGLFISIVNGLFELTQMMSWHLNYQVNELSKSREYLRDLSKFVALDELEDATVLPLNKGEEIKSLEFKNVSFKYPGTDLYILKNLSFTLKEGEHYAFVGANGSGKTTITKLITGLYEDFEGEILINDKNIKDYNYGELKSMCSVVYQDFSKYYISVKDNILLGDINNKEKESQEDKIKNAIKVINIQDVIEELPNKLDTPLGKIKEDGQDLSGGQWQRIAMARSIISSSSLRILDEPTSALDPISESNLYEEFKEVSKNKTTIFISHRLGSTRLAKEIFVLGDGSVIEKGTHEELMSIKGAYSKMYESQRSWYL
ncbi:ABC transporter ATP-binding protein [Clostridium hydrogeniformans]|uniref:ABC transporter ATP-binding protein n=1 Tax=Clostridium hydrogeniformans TaxID=349933 RepID=UPI000486C2EE|nr:ABC transporter ATP-binding protein [Clostridium hydrogeniformans]